MSINWWSRNRRLVNASKRRKPLVTAIESLEDRCLLANWSGDLPNGTHWSNSEVQVLTGNVNIPAGATLTIDPGTVIKFADYHFSMTVQGKVLAQGTAGAPITFTEFRDDVGGDTNGDGGASTPSRGNWGGIEFQNGSAGSILDHVNLRYGGYGISELFINGGGLTLSNSAVAFSYSDGVRIQNGSPVFNHDIFQNNSGAALSSDLASQIVSTGATIDNNGTNGLTLNAGALPGNVTWNAPDITLFVPGTITVPANQTLTIDAGQIVKFNTSGTQNLIVNGTLSVAGTAAAPVIFTSSHDSSAGGDLLNLGNSSGRAGDWGRIEFASTSTASVLDHAEVRFGGYDTLGEVLVNGGQLALSNSEIRDSNAAGLRILASNPTVTNVIFQGNVQAAISMDLASNPTITGGAETHNGINGLSLDGGNLLTNGLWDDTAITYFISSTIAVPVDKTLTIAPGQLVKVNFNGNNNLIVNGTLNAIGTSAQPIIVTSAHDDAVGGDVENNGPTVPRAGDWGRIEFTNTSTNSTLDHVQVSFGGSVAPGEVYLNGGELTLSHSTIRDSSSNGLRIEQSHPIVSGVTFQNNAFAAMSMDLGSNPAISGITITTNGINGLSLDGGTLSANGVWDDPEVTYFLFSSITVPSTLSLTIGAGQVIKPNFNGTTDLIVNGTLDANGTAAHPIVFTSAENDAVGTDIENNGVSTPRNGDWGHLEFNNSSRLSTLNHVDVGYGGYHAAALVIDNGGQLSIADSTIRHSVSEGLRIIGASPTLTNVTLQDNSGVAITMNLAAEIQGTGLSATGNASNLILVDGGNLPFSRTWDATGIDFQLNNTVTMADGETLTLSAGSVFDARETTEILGAGSINNAGTIQKTAGGGASTISPHVINTGTVDVQSGVLILAAGVENNGNGIVTGATNATLELGQSLTGDIQHSPATPLQPTLLFNGLGTAATPQLLEAFSADLGNVPTGFEHNFAFNTVTVATGKYIKLVDANNNSPGNGPEAVYVNSLTVQGGATLNLNGLHLYSRFATLNGNVINGTVTILPDSGPLTLNALEPGRIAVSGELDDWTFFGRASQILTVTLSVGASGATPPASAGLNLARLELLDSSNHVIATTTSTTSGADLQLTGISLPSDGTYHLQVKAAPSALNGTGAYVLAAWDATINVSPAEVNQTVTGDIHTPFRIDRWTFSGIAGQVINFNLINAENPHIVFDLTGPAGFTAFSSQSIDTNLISLPATGSYTVSVHTTQRATGAYAFKLESVSVNTLGLNGTFTGTLAGGTQSQLFKIAVPDQQQLLVLLSDTSATDRNEVYIKFGSSPTRSDYQYKFTTPASANQVLSVPSAAPGDWYVLVYTDSAVQPGNITLQVKGGSVFLTDVTPDHLGNSADMSLTLDGAGFDNSTAVSLVSANNTVFNANAVRLDLTTQITATFNAGAVPAGTYSVRLTKGDGGTSTLPNAFTVSAGGAAKLETKVIVPNPIGYHIASTIYVQYSNTGTVAMPAPLLVLSATQSGIEGALLTLDPALQVSGFWTSATPAGYSQSVQILASGATPGVLQPGETETVPVYYAGWLTGQWDFSRPPIYFNLGSLTTDSSATVDGAALKQNLQPSSISDSAWAGIYPNLVSQLGNTWGNVIQHLDQDASYLGSLGEQVTDISQLWSFEIQQANGLGPIPFLATGTEMSAPSAWLSLTVSRLFGNSITARNLNGPFGKGWQLDGGWGQNLTVASDGTVTLTDGTSVRQFQPDSRGSTYFSQPGDRSVLTKVISNVYTLTDPNGLVTQFESGRVVYLNDANGNLITAAYNGAQLASLTSSSGQSISFTYNNAGHIASLSNSLGQTAHFTYDASNQYLLSATDLNGTTTAYTYDMGAAPATKNTLLTITDATGVQQVFTYDPQGRLKTTAFQGGALTSQFGYGPAGVVTVTNPTNDSTTYYYDARSLLAKVINPLQQTTFYTYSSAGNLLTVTNPAGNIYAYAYDSQGRAIQATNPLGQVTKYTYGSFNNVTSVTDPNGNRTTFQFDPNGDAVSQVFADGTVESLAYDPIGQITQSTDGDGNIISYSYNSAGQVVTKHYADGSETTFSYNALSKLNSVTDSSGSTTLDYDGSNLLKQITYPSGSYLKYTYDSAGRRIQMVDQTGYTVQFHYDALSRFTGLTDGANQAIVTYSYDLDGRLDSATKANGTSTRYTYDNAGKVLSIVNHAPGQAVNSSFVYTYNNQALCATETTLQGQWVYTYDATGQLTHAVLTSNNPAQSPNQDLQYFYDAAGNRTKTITNGVTTTYTSNSRNEYTAIGATAYTYDADGSRTSQTDASGTTNYTYNADGQLAKVTPSTGPATSYQYNAFGGIVSTIQNGQQTNNLFDPVGGTLVGQFGSDGTVQAHYNYGFGLVNQVGPTGTTNFYDFDLRGSTVGMTNAAGAYVNSYSYLPFGTVASSVATVANPFQFVGQFGVISNSGQPLLMGARQYDTAIGQFLEEDPAGRSGGDLNLHRYADNNPITRIDPNGLDSTSTGFSEFPSYSVDYAKQAREDRETEKLQAILGILSKVSLVLQQLEQKHKLTHSQVEKALEIILFNLVLSDGEILHEGQNPPKKPVVSANPTAVIGVSTGVVLVVGASVVGGGPPSPESPSDDTQTPVTEAPPVDTLPDPVANPPLETPPVEAQTPVQTESTNTHDPNDLIGPIGFGSNGYIPEDVQTFPYRIDFENSPTAIDPVQRVVVTNQLNSNFDWNTFELTGAGFGDTVISIPSGSQFYRTTEPMTYNGISFVVEVTLGIHSETGQVYATFQALNPETSLPPDALAGFLPPEDQTGRGTGYISYIIHPKQNLTTGTQVHNVATIYFDSNPAITTDQINDDDPSKGVDPTRQGLLTIDVGTPVSAVTALPATSTANFMVSWSGSDDTGGSGIASFDIYSSLDGGNYTLWQSATSATSAVFNGLVGHTYRFYSIARDNVGHVELAPATADTTTTIVLFNTPPVISDQSFHIAENSPANSMVGTVAAIDPDIPTVLTYNITGGSSANLFTIDSLTGAISVATGTVLNFEGTATYVLTVQVTDDGSPNKSSSAQVTIHVDDVNEAPVITAGQTFTVSGSAAAGFGIGTVIAADPDTGAPNNSRNFGILNGTGVFVINSQTGALSVGNATALTALAGQVVTLQISDADGGTPALSTTQNVSITVGPANTAPVLATPGPVSTFVGNAPTPVKVVPTLSVTDANGPATLASIVISLPLGAAKKNPDIVSLPGLSAIGTRTDAIVSGRLQITIVLKPGATNAAVQAMLDGMTFQTKAAGLKLLSRTFQIQVTDNTGLHSNTVTQNVVVEKKAPKPPRH
jgi:RHS repeat-associated protein